jgi:hypothetical protein
VTVFRELVQHINIPSQTTFTGKTRCLIFARMGYAYTQKGCNKHFDVKTFTKAITQTLILLPHMPEEELKALRLM